MKDKKISIIVPVYNIGNYIEECIDSILHQTYRNIEVILIDDGSTDNSSDLCDKYAYKDKRIKVLHKKNEGLVRARKDGIRMATGPFIGYVDGDDWIEPDMYEKLYAALYDHNVDIAMCGRYEDTGDKHIPVFQGIPEGYYDKKKLISNVYPNMVVNGSFFEWGIFPGVWDKLFKRECIEKYQMAVNECLTMGEDAACTYPCLLNVNNIYILHECLYHYRQSNFSMVKNQKDPIKEKMNFKILYTSVLQSLEKHKDICELTKQWKEYVLFLMTPRAGYLYDDIENMEFLFPFSKVKRGSNIVLYGMGTYGQLLFEYLKKSHFCNVIACADRNYKELNKMGLNVVAPDAIAEYNYDFIVVANSFAKTRIAIRKELADRFDVDKIQIIDENVIMSNRTLEAFGLMDKKVKNERES